MNDQENQNDLHLDDQSVLTFLLEHVKGLRPVSTTDEFAVADDDISYS